MNHRNSQEAAIQMFFKISSLKDFAIFTGNTCVGISFLKSCKSSGFNKKRLQHKCFPVNIAKFLRAAFFIEHLGSPTAVQ